MVSIGRPLPEALRGAALLREDGQVVAFHELCADQPLLAVFLRHFGCIGCADAVHALLPRVGEIAALGVRIVLVGNGPREAIDAFATLHGLADKPVEIVTDPTLRAFETMGLGRSVWATFGPRAVVDFLRAFSRGHLPRGTKGDLLQQGGALLVDRGAVVWMHRSESLGGYPDPSDVVDAVLGLRSTNAPAWI